MRKVLYVLSVFLIAAAPGTVYVQSLKATVMVKPSFKSSPIFTAEKGDELAVLEHSGRWIKVSRGGYTGWVPALVVGPRPPMGKVTVFTGEEADISKESRRRASAVTSAAAARGLTEDDRRRLGFKGTLDFAALEKVESFVVTEDEVEEFLKTRD